MKIHDIPAETTKAITAILQQRATLATTHQRASKELAFFQLESNNDDRGIIIKDEDREATVAALKDSIRFAAEGLKSLALLGLDS